MSNFLQAREKFRGPDSISVRDPLDKSPWVDPATVAAFSRSEPNSALLAYAARRVGVEPVRVLDIGCGAGRNAAPLMGLGCVVFGVDLSRPMLVAASQRASGLQLACAPMDALPVRDRSFNLIVAHGIWNLAKSEREFRGAIAEAARVATPGARLFVFTFSRRTLAADATPVEGTSFVFTQFSGAPQVFLTSTQLYDELAAVGFSADPDLPLRELNVPPPGAFGGHAPVIYQAGFRFEGD
jgi:SAM-dependent methyltransferase